MSILAGDYSFNPELAGFVQFAIDESNLAQNPTTFDDAMTTPSKTVISFGNCPTGGRRTVPEGTITISILVAELADWNGQFCS